MEKLDFKKAFSQYYSPKSGSVQEVALPLLQFATVTGKGDPNGPAFREAIEALYGLSYTLKFSRKKAGLEPDYTVGPLEAVWWDESQGKEFMDGNREAWQWRAMIWQPDFITATEFSTAIAEVEKKKPSPSVMKLKLEQITEGRSVQVMHIGPYSAETENIERLLNYADEHGLIPQRMGHHEIYLSDPRRVPVERLKTIIRYPVQEK